MVGQVSPLKRICSPQAMAYLVVHGLGLGFPRFGGQVACVDYAT
jgi:hypothetical protein